MSAIILLSQVSLPDELRSCLQSGSNHLKWKCDCADGSNSDDGYNLTSQKYGIAFFDCEFHLLYLPFQNVYSLINQIYIYQFVQMWIKHTKFFISLNAIKLYTPNSKKQKALIIHHGMLGSAKNLRPLCKNSRLLNYVDVLLIDARNHGQSPHTNSHTVTDLADDLNQYIQKQRKNYDKFTVLGHSMGGIGVMQFTRRYVQAQKYVQRIVIVDIPCNSKTSKGNWSQQGQFQMLQNANKIDLTQKTSQIFKQIQTISLDSDYANLIKFNVKILSDGSHRWKVNLPIITKHYKQMTNYSLQSCEWKGPVEVIYGSESTYFQEDQICEYMRQYPQMSITQNFHKIEGAGHWVHFDKKQAFLNTVQKILSRNS